MKMARLRKSGKRVSARAVHNMWVPLEHLWLYQPRMLVEFARHARDRRHQPLGRSTFHVLGELGLIGGGNKFPVHDAYRDLVDECVEGDGLTTDFRHPFEEKYTEAPKATMRDGTPATVHIVASILEELTHLHDAHYVTFVELGRMLHAKQHPFGKTLQILERHNFGEARRVEEIDVRQLDEGMAARLETLECPTAFLVSDLVSAVAKVAIVGERGLEVSLQSPFQTVAEPIRNGRAPRDSRTSNNGRDHGRGKDHVFGH